jgi:DNA-binding XRE family transcriptional regulator
MFTPEYLKELQSRYPLATIKVTNTKYISWMTIAHKGRLLSFNIRRKSYHVSSNILVSSTYDEEYKDFSSAALRFYELLDGASTTPAIGFQLKKLREMAKLTQVQLAKKMGITQGALTKIEKKSDISVDIFKAYVKALGATPILTISFAYGSVDLNLG